MSNIIYNESKYAYATTNSFEERVAPLEHIVKNTFEAEKLIYKWVVLNEKRQRRERWVKKTWK